jgi:protease-4
MRKFLLGILAGFILAATAAVILVFAAVQLGRPRPVVPDGAVLVYRLQGAIPEAPPMEIPLPFFERHSPATVKENWELLRKAAADSRIRAVVFMPQDVSAGWAKLQEIRAGLLALRKSGKPVYAYLRSPGTREYYLATAAERIYMGPEDLLNLKGLRAEAIYLKRTLDKIGVEVEIEHAGKFKDAPDTFTRTSMSPETREVLNSILDDLYGHLVESIAAGRRQAPVQVRETIDHGPFIAQDALSRGLVDALRYEDEVFGELKGKLKLAEVKKISQADYRRVSPASLGLEGNHRIAFVVAEGDIVRDSGEDMLDGGFVGAAEFTKLLRRVGDDRNTRGVVVRIDSPGGDAFASDEIWREMHVLSRKKPVVISMSDSAASGGYYMALTGDPILAYPGTFTGSIGVFFGKVNLRGLYDKLGVRKETLTRGRFANIDSDYEPLGAAGRQKLRQSIETFYRSFVEKVADARKRPYDEVAPLAEGRVWLGSQAKHNGLVDELGGLDRAIELVKKKAGIPAREKVRLVTYPPRRTIFDELLGRSSIALGNSELASLLRRFSTVTWREGGFLRLMPYTLEVK